MRLAEKKSEDYYVEIPPGITKPEMLGLVGVAILADDSPSGTAVGASYGAEVVTSSQARGGWLRQGLALSDKTNACEQ